jgi:hypothetical protein
MSGEGWRLEKEDMAYVSAHFSALNGGENWQVSKKITQIV